MLWSWMSASRISYPASSSNMIWLMQPALRCLSMNRESTSEVPSAPGLRVRCRKSSSWWQWTWKMRARYCWRRLQQRKYLPFTISKRLRAISAHSIISSAFTSISSSITSCVYSPRSCRMQLSMQRNLRKQRQPCTADGQMTASLSTRRLYPSSRRATSVLRFSTNSSSSSAGRMLKNGTREALNSYLASAKGLANEQEWCVSVRLLSSRLMMWLPTLNAETTRFKCQRVSARIIFCLRKSKWGTLPGSSMPWKELGSQRPSRKARNSSFLPGQQQWKVWSTMAKTEGSSGRRRVWIWPSMLLNSTPPQTDLILWKMVCRCAYFCWMTSSSAWNLFLRWSSSGVGGRMKRRWTQAWWSCSSTWAYLSLISQICRKMMLVFSMSWRSALRSGAAGSAGGQARRACACSEWKKAMRSAVKLFRLKLFSYSFRNSSDTSGELKNTSSFSSRLCVRGSQNRNFSTSRSRLLACFRSWLKYRLISFNRPTFPSSQRIRPSTALACSPSARSSDSFSMRLSSRRSWATTSSKAERRRSLMWGWMLPSSSATSPAMRASRFLAISGSFLRERMMQWRGGSSSSLLSLSDSIIFKYSLGHAGRRGGGLQASQPDQKVLSPSSPKIQIKVGILLFVKLRRWSENRGAQA